MKISNSLTLLLFGLAAVLPVQAAEINVPDLTQTPTIDASQQNDVATPNGGVINNNVNSTLSYYVTTFAFGANSQAHIRTQYQNSGGTNRLGVKVEDSGLVVFEGTGDPGRTNFDMNPLGGGLQTGEMAGRTVTLLVRSYYNTTNDGLRATLGTGDDLLMNVWVNPTGASTETAVTPGDANMLNDGDMHTLWNSYGFFFLRTLIENQATPGGAGDNFINNTTLLTGADATFANALAIATGATGIVDAGTSTVSASPAAAPADGTTTSSITVTLKDAGGSPVAGKEVSLAGDGSGIIATSNNTSDASGVVVFTVKSNVVGLEEFTATDVTDSNLSITATASVDFQEVIPVGPVDAGNSTVVASVTSVPANGITTSTITVTLKDSNGQLVTGEDVTLAGSPPNASISPSATRTTDVNGEAAFTVSSSTIGTIVFTATSATDNVIITQTAGVDFTEPQDAESFNVNFLDEGMADETGLIGVVGEAGETWNQGTSSVSNLVDTTGTVVSTVSVSGLSTSGRPISGSTLGIFSANRDLFGKGDDVTISITGLTPGTPYDVYVYALSHSTSSWGEITDTERAKGDFVTTNTVLGNGQSQFLDNAMPGTSGNAFVPNGNYVAFESIVSDGSGNITIVADAYDGIDGIRTTNDGNCRLHLCGLQIRPASGMSVDYMNWRGSFHPGLGLPGGDDDGDGLSNDYERIFGLDPANPGSSNPYSTPIDPSTGSFGYTRRARTLANLNYKIWYSTDLDQWFEDNAANQLVGSVTDDIEMMSVEIDPALLEEAKLFLQVRATAVTEVDPEPSLVNLWGSGNTITLLFSEPMNPSSIENVNNYTVEQDGGSPITVTGATMSSDGGSVTLTLGSALGIDTGYTVDVDGVTSSTGQSLGIGVSRQFRTWDDDPAGIKVFILAGQSNMVGRGNVEDGATGAGTIGSLRYLAANNGSYPEYDYTSLLTDPGNTASAFRNRSDVKVWYRDGGNGNLGGAIKKGNLGPPYMGSDTGKIGPEYAFGQVIGDYYASNNVLIVKCAWGGRDLAEKFRPPSAVANRGGQVGDFYNAIIEYTRQVLYNLDTEFPEWAGQGYQIVGFGWHQGYNDRINTTFSAEYKDNLPDLISDVRDVFNKPNMPVVIASTGMEIGDPEPAPYTGYTAVEKAQLWAAGVAQPSDVLSTDTRPFWRNPAESPATSGQGFHWNHNAESYFLIGKAMGDNMVSLLGP